MIETVHAAADSPYLVESPDTLAKLLEGQSVTRKAGAFIWREGPSATRLKLARLRVGPNKGAWQYVLETNLPGAVYGDDGKAGTLRPEHVRAGVGLALESLRYWVPNMPTEGELWKLRRVDANRTYELLQDDATTWVRGVGESSPEWLRLGPISYRRRYASELEVAVYGKTAQLGIRGPRGGDLVRVEERCFGRKCRSVYGGTLADLVDLGGDVAQRRTKELVGRLALAVRATTAQDMAKALIRQGCDAKRAWALAAPAVQIVRDGGPSGLIASGVPKSTAYDWMRELGDVFGIDQEQGVLLEVDDVVYGDAL